jgi:hypothetical protein
MEIHYAVVDSRCNLTEHQLNHLLIRLRLGEWKPSMNYKLPFLVVCKGDDTNKKSMLESSKEETRKHIAKVHYYIDIIRCTLLNRAYNHDMSKLEDPEVSVFAEMTGKLKESTYGSDEYKEFLKQMKPALDHHYANNRHHPEKFDNGVNDMTLVDLVEMLCDWKAASQRNDNGDILKSIEINTERFELSPQLKQILINTVEEDLK